MSRNRTATAVLDARGAFKNHPDRKRDNEPVPEGEFPEAFNHLTDEQKAMWNEVKSVVPAGVLTSADPYNFEVLIKLILGFREKGLKLAPNLMTRLSTELDKFGLSPSGRAKLAVVKTKGNKFDDV